MATLRLASQRLRYVAQCSGSDAGDCNRDTGVWATMSLKLLQTLTVAMALQAPSTGPVGPSATAEHETLLRIAQTAVGTEAQVCDVARIRAVHSPDMIIAPIDTSGRRFCTEVNVLVLRPHVEVVDSLETSRVPSAASLLRDLDGDGNDEVVLPRALSFYEGTAACMAVIPAVYRCSKKGCVESGKEFSRFYRSELALRSALKGGTNAFDLPCLLMEIAKLERLNGDDLRARIALAEQWAHDADPTLRRKAIDIFADIDDSVATANLAALEVDPDPGVASHVEPAIAKFRKSPALPSGQ
jgi:hypothetical protein